MTTLTPSDDILAPEEAHGNGAGDALPTSEAQPIDAEPVIAVDPETVSPSSPISALAEEEKPRREMRRPVIITTLVLLLLIVGGGLGGFFYLRSQEAAFVQAGQAALEDLNASLELDPTLDAHRAYRALIWFDQDLGSQALPESESAVESAALDSELKLALRWARLNYYYAAQGDFAASLAEGEKLLALDAKAGLPYALRAWQHYQSLESEQALVNAKQAIGYDPDLGLAYRVRGSLSAFHYDVKPALTDLDKAVKLDGKDFHALAMRGFVHLLNEDLEMAQADIQNAAQLSENAPVVLWAQAMEKLYTYEEVAAATLIDKALQVDDSRPEYFWARGLAYTLTDERENRAESFNQALQIQADFAPAVLGLAYDRLIMYDKTNIEEDAQKLAEWMPTSCSPHVLLVAFYNWQRSTEKSEAALARAIELEPDHAQVEILKGWAVFKLEDYDQAVRHFQKALDLRENSVAALDGKSRVYLAQQDFAKAREQAEKILVIDQDSLLAHVLLAEIALAEGNPDTALVVLEQAAVIDPNAPAMLLARSEAYLQLKDPVKGLLDVTRLIEWVPLDAEAHAIAGRFYLLQKDINQARSFANKALKLDPQNENGYRVLLGIAVEKQDWDNVVIYGKKLLALKIHDAAVYENLSVAYYEKNDEKRAIEYGLQALELDNTLERVHSQFIDIYWRQGNIEQAQEYAQLVIDHSKDDDRFASAEEDLAFLKKIPRVVDGKRTIQGWDGWPINMTYDSSKWAQVPTATESIRRSGLFLVPTDNWNVDAFFRIELETLDSGWRLDINGSIRYWDKKYKEMFGSSYKYIAQESYRFPDGPGQAHVYRLFDMQCKEYWYADYKYGAWTNYYMGAGFCTDIKDFNQVSAEVDKIFETLRINP